MDCHNLSSAKSFKFFNVPKLLKLIFEIRYAVVLAIINLYDIQASTDSTVLEKLPPDSTEQQAQITLIQDDDGYNWGYAPKS